MRERLRTLFIVLSALCAAMYVSAEVVEGHQSVGLVLSGGGAKGIAHIGVIKALEDNNIPIDYITGTSMGAIVGGLYASGYTPEEMMKLLLSEEFANWSTGHIDQKLVYNFFKPSLTPAILNVPIARPDSTKATSLIPSSMISPLPMNFAFMELFSAYTAQCEGNFNKLFVPFRCVTSDVYAKHKVVCSSGNLGDAIRASMSFPTVFQPIEMDGVLMYDGGIYDNFPVDVMREDFAPSIMIGVDVSSQPGAPRSGDLINQLEDMIMQKSDYNLPADEGIRIKIDLQRFSLLDFPKARQIYQIGYDHAMAMMDSIKGRVRARIPSEARELRRRVFKSATPYVRFDSVAVSGGTRSQDSYLRYLFTRNRPGTISMHRAKLAYYQAITGGNLRNLLPNATYNDTTGLFTLDLKADPRDNLRIGFGGYITSSTNSMIFMSANYSTLSYHAVSASANMWIGQSYMAGSLNGRIYLPSHVPSALNLQAVIARQKFYESDNLFYEDKTPTFIIDNEIYGRLSYAWAMGRNGMAEIGVGAGQLKSNFFQHSIRDYANLGRDYTKQNLMQTRISVDRNTLDSPIFPTNGSRYQLLCHAVTGNYEFTPYDPDDVGKGRHRVSWLQARLVAHNYFGIGKRFSVGTMVDALISSRPVHGDYDAAIVTSPAYNPTPATYNSFNPAFRAYSYVALGVVPIWKINDRLQMRGDCHAFVPYREIIDDNGHAKLGREFRRGRFFGEMALVYNFPFQAALSVYGNYYSYPKDNWNFGISFGAFFLAPGFLK